MKLLIFTLLIISILISESLSSVDYIKGEPNTNQLVVAIDRNGFRQEYKLLFTEKSSDEVNDLDALKIGEGYVSIAGVVNGKQLSIDRRATLVTPKEIKLYVRGWSTGNYTLTIKGKETFSKLTQITLIDKYTNKHESIKTGEKIYDFQIDSNEPGSYGKERFSLLFEQQQTPQVRVSETETIYPNPFSDKLNLKVPSGRYTHITAIIRNSLGVVVSQQQISLQRNDPEIAVKDLVTGIYFIQLIDQHTNKTISVFKALKN